MHICAPCKITQQEQSKQMGMCRRKPQAPQGRGLCAAVTDGSFSIMSKGQVHSCGPDAVAWPHDLQYALNTGHGTMSHVCLFLPHGSANISTAWAQRYPCVKCLSENPSWPMTHQEQIFCQAAQHLGEELPPWGKNRLRHSQFWGQTTSLAANLRGSFSSLSGPPVCHPLTLVGVFNFFYFLLLMATAWIHGGDEQVPDKVSWGVACGKRDFHSVILNVPSIFMLNQPLPFISSSFFDVLIVSLDFTDSHLSSASSSLCL